jgi:molybdopterin molybdotransferase
MSTMPAPQVLMPVDVALRRLLARLTVTEVEHVGLLEALGRVLATDVVSLRRVPGCDNSAMDGYAVRRADCAAATEQHAVTLPVLGEARAGVQPAILEAGTAMAITTGAPVPLGADAIVPVEDTERRDGHVLIRAAAAPGAHVRAAGGDVEPGTVMVPAGQRLRPVDLAACATAGAGTVPVRRRPRVAILGGGDELVAPGVDPAPHQVTDSNSSMLSATVVEAGGVPLLLGVMTDERDSVRSHLLVAAECDLVVSSAGVSVGAHDHVRSVVEELGSVDVWRIAVRPGRPLLLGEVRGTPVMGLPGNPVSSAVTFELFGRPAILAMQGASRVRRRRIAVRLGEEVQSPAGLESYLRVRLEDADDGIPMAWLSGNQGSSMVRSLAAADALLAVAADREHVAAGSVLPALELT